MRYEELIEKYLKNDNLDLEKLIKDEGIAKDLAEKIYSEWKNYHDEVFWHNAIYEISFMEEPPTPVRIMKQFDISYVFAEALYNYYVEVANDYMEDKDVSFDEYLLNGSNQEPVSDFGLVNSFKERLDDFFGINLKVEHLKRVMFGEGSEVSKMNSLHSSSVQSLVIFNNVSEKNPITIDGEKYTYTNVIFEYKNRVIKKPSCVDVVLSTKNYKKLLFIESKLFEMVDSSYDKDCDSCIQIGKSYLATGENSYEEALGIKEDDFQYLGISKIDSGSHAGEGKIVPLKGSKYTYPYGIKQFLSHVIGIKNVFDTKNNKNCDKDLEKYKNSVEEIKFVTLINSLTGYKEKNSEEKIKDFVNHYLTVEKYLKDDKSSSLKTREKEIKIELCGIHSYQWLYENNKGYFKNLGKVVEFYKLNREDKIDAMTKKD